MFSIAAIARFSFNRIPRFCVRMSSSPHAGQTRPLDDPSASGHRPAKRVRNRKNGPKAKHQSLPEPCSPEDVLWKDIVALLGQNSVDNAIAEGSDFEAPFNESWEELEVEIHSLSSDGALESLHPFSHRLNTCRPRIGACSRTKETVGSHRSIFPPRRKSTRQGLPSQADALSRGLSSCCAPKHGSERRE